MMSVKHMKWYGGAVILILMGLIALLFFDKSRPTLENKEADYRLGSGALAAAFVANERRANERYLGKILEISGSVREVIRDKNSLGLILDTESEAGVYCVFTTDPPDVSQGDYVVIKGICSGFLMDVVMNDCAMKTPRP